MSLASVFAKIDAEYKEQVMQDTWGHLAPKKNTTYRGVVVFGFGCFGDDPLNACVLTSSFPDLDDSPWFFNALTEFLDKMRKELLDDGHKSQTGKVYVWKGSFRNYVFYSKKRYPRLVLDTSTIHEVKAIEEN